MYPASETIRFFSLAIDTEEESTAGPGIHAPCFRPLHAELLYHTQTHGHNTDSVLSAGNEEEESQEDDTPKVLSLVSEKQCSHIWDQIGGLSVDHGSGNHYGGSKEALWQIGNFMTYV